MSVKRDASGRQSIQVEVEVPGTVEEVWKAVATGPGISSWFCPTEIEEKTGGVIRTLMGPGMESLARVTVWDPPRRLAAEGPGAGPDAPPMTTEWIVEARSGDACLVRVIHSMSGGTDEQREQLEGIECGWPYFFAILRVYLAHFRGQPASIIRSMGAECGSGKQCLERPDRRPRDNRPPERRPLDLAPRYALPDGCRGAGGR